MPCLLEDLVVQFYWEDGPMMRVIGGHWAIDGIGSRERGEK